jgi:heat shock protein HslJ
MKNKTKMITVLGSVLILGIIALTACTSKAISLEGTRWNVKEINGEPVLENSKVTMEFTADQVAGKASCNNYFTSYNLEGDQLNLGLAGSTMMYCEGVMDQEALFLSSLEKVETVSIKGSEMTISLNDGGSIVLVEQ